MTTDDINPTERVVCDLFDVPHLLNRADSGTPCQNPRPVGEPVVEAPEPEPVYEPRPLPEYERDMTRELAVFLFRHADVGAGGTYGGLSRATRAFWESIAGDVIKFIAGFDSDDEVVVRIDDLREFLDYGLDAGTFIYEIGRGPEPTIGPKTQRLIDAVEAAEA